MTEGVSEAIYVVLDLLVNTSEVFWEDQPVH